LSISIIKNKKEETIKEKLSELEQKLLDSERELTSSLIELNAGYIMALLPKINHLSGIHSIKGYPVSELVQPEIFKKMLEDTSNITYKPASNQREVHVGLQFAQLIDELSPHYEQRKVRIFDKSKNVRQTIYKDIDQLNLDLSVLHEQPMTEIIRTSSREKLFEKILDKQLLILLLERGYIDQHYDEYISHFHEGHMTINDMAFIKTVQNDEEVNPLCKIDNFTEAYKIFIRSRL
jgi:hypothetical protein